MTQPASKRLVTEAALAEAVAAGGSGSATTDASLLTSGTLAPARIADASIADAKLAAGTALTPAERTKLSGVASGATANATDAQLRDRSTHTGTQPASTISGLGSAVAADAAVQAAFAPTSQIPVWRPIGTGAEPIPLSTAALTSGNTQTGGTGIKRLVSAVATSLLKVQWGNFLVGGQESHAGLGDLTIAAATIEYPAGTFTPLFFNGNTGTVLKPGGIATSDEAAVAIPANTPYWVRTYATWTAGQNIALHPLPTGNGQASQLAVSPTDKTQTAGTASMFDVYGPAPVAVLGRVLTSADALLVLGDSIADGTGDYPDSQRGYVVRATEGAYAVQKITAPSGRAMYEAPTSGRWRKTRLMGGTTCALEVYGQNDLNPPASRTLAQIQADKLTLWAWLKTVPGMLRVYAGTITPYTSSTDGWMTAGSQAPQNTTAETNRVALNDWLRDGAPVVSAANLTAVATGTAGALRAGAAGHPLDGYVELADTIEANSANVLTRNGGRWKVGTTRTVTDAAITTGTKTLTSATAAFVAGDVGSAVTIAGAGSAGALYVGSINSVTNSTTAVLVANASTTVSAASSVIGGPTADGLHPSSPTHQAMSVALAAAMPAITA